MRYSIVIPSCRPREKVEHLIYALERSCPNATEVIHTGYEVCASANRNMALMLAKEEVIVMIDDDMMGFFPNWADKLIEPLKQPVVKMVSARLLNQDGSLGLMMDNVPDHTVSLQPVKEQALPSACIAFRNTDLRFDEEYQGSGWEDTDFCAQIVERDSGGIFLIHNEVKLVHLNQQKGSYFELNKQRFMKKWSKR